MRVHCPSQVKARPWQTDGKKGEGREAHSTYKYREGERALRGVQVPYLTLSEVLKQNKNPTYNSRVPISHRCSEETLGTTNTVTF